MPDKALKVMLCLKEELDRNPAPDRSYEVLLFLVEASIKALDKGDTSPQTFDRPSLQKNVNPSSTLDPNRWLNWKQLNTSLDARMTSLLKRLDQKGLDSKPVVKSSEGTGRSNLKTFWLDIEPITQADRSESDNTDTNRLLYERSEATEIKPSWFLRPLFPEGELKTRSRRGYALLTLTVFGLLFWLLWLIVAFWVLVLADQELTSRRLFVSVFLLGTAWFIWRDIYQPWFRLPEDRVIKAPDLFLAINEDPAEIELFRDDDKSKWIRFVRFTGDCPLCSGQVFLKSGKPEHLVPLVGRCSESPHAHVFSFDRVKLTGVYIGPE